MNGQYIPLLDKGFVILFFRCMLVWQSSALKRCGQLSIWKVTDLHGVNQVGKWSLPSYLLLYNVMFCHWFPFLLLFKVSVHCQEPLLVGSF